MCYLRGGGGDIIDSNSAIPMNTSRNSITILNPRPNCKGNNKSHKY